MFLLANVNKSQIFLGRHIAGLSNMKSVSSVSSLRKFFSDFLSHGGGGKGLRIIKTKKSTSESLLSSHLSLFIRRQRNITQNNHGKEIKATLKGVKIDKNGVKRLLGLAKPERFKIAGK